MMKAFNKQLTKSNLTWKGLNMKKTVIVSAFEDTDEAFKAVDEFQTIIQKGDTVKLEVGEHYHTVRVELNTDDVNYARELLKEFLSNTGFEKEYLVLDGRYYEEETNLEIIFIITYDMAESNMKTTIYTVTYGNKINPHNDYARPETRIATNLQNLINILENLTTEFHAALTYTVDAYDGKYNDWREMIMGDAIGYYHDDDMDYFINISEHEITFNEIKLSAKYID